MRWLSAVIVTVPLAAAAQPFQGTVFISPNVLTTEDPSSLAGVEYTGRGQRSIFDFRVMEWITVDAYLFEARIGGHRIEFQVNPEFESEDAARAQVDVYAPALGRLPAVLLSRLQSVHVNAGNPSFGGNYVDQSITVHTGRGQERLRDGFLEEVLFHEGAHVSLQNHQDEPGWLAAQAADPEFISDYARDNPDREDVAESILAYFAVRVAPGRISTAHRDAIEAAIPNRLEYFNDHAFDWSPFRTPVPALPAGAAAILVALLAGAGARQRRRRP